MSVEQNISCFMELQLEITVPQLSEGNNRVFQHVDLCGVRARPSTWLRECPPTDAWVAAEISDWTG